MDPSLYIHVAMFIGHRTTDADVAVLQEEAGPSPAAQDDKISKAGPSPAAQDDKSSKAGPSPAGQDDKI
jgi:hypothetical protein